MSLQNQSDSSNPPQPKLSLSSSPLQRQHQQQPHWNPQQDDDPLTQDCDDINDYHISNSDQSSQLQRQLTREEEVMSRITTMESKMDSFFIGLKDWYNETHTSLQIQMDMNDQMNNEYERRMSTLSRQRGTSNLRYESAIRQALVHQRELDNLQLELKNIQQQNEIICFDLKNIKEIKAKLQDILSELRSEQQRVKQDLMAQIQSCSSLVTKFALFLGLEVIPTELLNMNDYPSLRHTINNHLNNNNNTNNNENDKNNTHNAPMMHLHNNNSNNGKDNNNPDNDQFQIHPGCIFIRYTSLQPELSFILNPSPISVSYVSLPLPNLHLLQQHLVETQNLHHFFVKLYFLHKETYPQQFHNANDNVVATTDGLY